MALSSYPDWVGDLSREASESITGIKTPLGFGPKTKDQRPLKTKDQRPKISSSVTAQPDGLLRHETIIYFLFPVHLGMRQSWHDADSL